VILEVFTKDFMRTAQLEISTPVIPRVGESITVEQDVGYPQGARELLIYEVTHVLNGGRLTPVVRCMARSDEMNRRPFGRRKSGPETNLPSHPRVQLPRR